MLENFFNWVFEQWYHTVLAMFVFFNLLYWGAAWVSTKLIAWLYNKKLVQQVDNHAIYKGQVRTEITNSMLSIVVFSLQCVIIQQGIVNGWLYLSYSITWSVVRQIILLFLWNEIHFYIVHRILHGSWLIRHVHKVHHRSIEPTVYSTYSFHWVEAFLLGTVIIFPMAVYAFELPALLSLPVMSIVLNTLGHCNYELPENTKGHRFFRFSWRHSQHHKMGRGNYGFMLSCFDSLFKTRISNN